MKASNLGADCCLQKREDPKSQYGILANAIIHEINHHKAEKEKELARKEWEKTFDAMPEIVSLISPDFEFLKINGEGARSLGMEKEEIIGKKCYELVHGQNEPIDVCPCKKVLETGEPDIGEEFEENGRHYIAAASPIIDEDGEVEAYAHTVKDVTERVKAEEREKEALRDKERIMNTVPNIVYQINKEGRLVEWNERAVKVTKYSPEELEGTSALDFFPERESEKIKATIETAFQEGFAQVEARLLTKEKEKIPYSFTATPIRDENGDIAGLTGVGVDISERKEAEEQRDFLNTLLRQDLRSKFQTIQGYHQLLEKADLSDEYRGYLRKAVRTGRETNEILELAKKLRETGGVEGIGEKNILRILEDEMENITDLIERKGVEIKEDYPESVGKIQGDYSMNTLFSQIIKTRIQTSDCDKIRINLEDRKEDLLLRIEDNGKKLPEDVKKLFSGEVYTGETTGAGGVRYYMLREIAEHNNAKIEVQDSDLNGTRFDIYLNKT